VVSAMSEHEFGLTVNIATLRMGPFADAIETAPCEKYVWGKSDRCETLRLFGLL
jgi:hypothetical protein